MRNSSFQIPAHLNELENGSGLLMQCGRTPGSWRSDLCRAPTQVHTESFDLQARDRGPQLRNFPRHNYRVYIFHDL